MDALEALFQQFEDKSAVEAHAKAERAALRYAMSAPKGFGAHSIDEGRPAWPDDWFQSGDPSHGVRCRALWAAVLHQAWMDATKRKRFQQSPLDVSRAQTLLTTDNRDLQIICTILDLHVPSVIAATKKKIAEQGNIEQ